MNSQKAAFQRKVIYMVVLALLVYPIYALSAPAVVNESEGGALAKLRTEHDLSQANLGEIDPASESMKLASLGLNGVAVNMLWHQAIHYKKVEDYDNLYATLNQIRHLQSNFVAVFEFQGHNISYNVSVELDDYRRRYKWVKRGIEFLIEGTESNTREPRLQWNVGWFCSQKIGRADEKVLFRELFRNDHEFHELLGEYIDIDSTHSYADNKPDNWLVGRLWYLDAQRLVDKEGAKLRGKSPLVFNSFPPMSRINYVSSNEAEGNLEEQALIAWVQAGNDWEEFGRRQIPTSFGHNLRLGEEEQMRAEYQNILDELDRLAPGVRERLEKEREASLSPEQREARELPDGALTEEQYILLSTANETLNVTPEDIAAEAPADVQEKAQQLAAKAADRDLLADRIGRYRTIVNYEYWRMRCEVEQERQTLEARRLVRDAQLAYEDTDLLAAQEKFELAWEHWAKVFDKYPEMRDDVTGQDLMEQVKLYIDLMNRQLGESVPDDFPLRDLVEINDKDLLPPLVKRTDEEPAEPESPEQEATPAEETPDQSPADNTPSSEQPMETPAAPDESQAAEEPTGDDPRSVEPHPPTPPSLESAAGKDPRQVEPTPPVPPASANAS